MNKLLNRTRPKGYNKKVWEHCYKEAEENKKWANETIRFNSQWCKEASQASIELLGEYLSKQVHVLAKEAYDYLEMRSHGYTFIGNLDQPAYEAWVKISGKAPLKSKRWKYDHTNNTTSAVKINDKWTHWLTGELL